MKTLALKIDVDTWRGTREGVPRLMEILQNHKAGATFLFSLGRDHTGRALRRIFRPGFFRKVRRTSVLSHYGVKTLLYGTLLPGPHIGRSLKNVLRLVEAAGFEVGVHCFDHVRWQDNVASALPQWAESEMLKAFAMFEEVFGHAPSCHGAAGWQMNRHALRLTQSLGLKYASDCRGTHPFRPVWNGEPIFCPQWPTTLPTFDELLGDEGRGPQGVVNHLLSLTQECPPYGHVYTLHAELEGQKFASHFATLLDRWQERGYELMSVGAAATSVTSESLPWHNVGFSHFPGRSGKLLVQGEPYLGTISS